MKSYGQIAKPLNELLKKGKYSWNEVAELAFQKLKEAMIAAQILALPYYSKTFMVETDASGEGTGVVLMQDGHPIAYISKVLSPKNRCLSTYERELLAVLFAIKHWEHYLLPRHFVIRTDHKRLRFLLEQRVSTTAQQAWLTKLQPFDCEIQYKQGFENRAADALSKLSSGTTMAITTRFY